MKKFIACILLAACTCSVAAYAKSNTTPSSKAAQKIAKKNQKAMGKYYKNQQKAQKKALKQAQKQQKHQRHASGF